MTTITDNKHRNGNRKTVKLSAKDHARLERLARNTKRHLNHMVSFLIDEYQRHQKAESN